MFRSWSPSILPGVELNIIQYPGREERFSEPLVNNPEVLLQELYDALYRYLDKPFVFFGHSMGGDIARCLLTERQKHHMLPARCLIVSGTRAPHLKQDRQISTDLDDNQFLELLKARGGMPDELLRNSEFMSLLMPRLRADIAVAEALPFSADRLIQHPVAAFGGDLDPEVSYSDIKAWRAQTNSTFRAQRFPGNHFFINQSRAQVINAVNGILSKLVGWDENRLLENITKH